LRKTHINVVMSLCLPVLLSIQVKQLGFPRCCSIGRVNCCWPSPVQSFLIPTPAELVTTFYTLTALRVVQSLWIDFRKNSCGRGLLKSLDIIQLSLKLGRDNGHLTENLTLFLESLSLPPSLPPSLIPLMRAYWSCHESEAMAITLINFKVIHELKKRRRHNLTI
jgi:hypothetical protein